MMATTGVGCEVSSGPCSEADMQVGVQASPGSASFGHLLRKRSHSVRVQKQVSRLYLKVYWYPVIIEI